MKDSKTSSTLLSPEQLKKAASLLKAVAHPIRLSILQLIEREGQLSVTDICEKLDCEQSLTSHHLANMKSKGILSCERDGQKILYSLKITELSSLLRCMENCACHFDK